MYSVICPVLILFLGLIIIDLTLEEEEDMIEVDGSMYLVICLLLLSLFGLIVTDLTPEEEEEMREAKEDDELMKIIVIEMIRDNDNCRSYFPWSRKDDDIYEPTEVHCNHACELIADLYLLNHGGDNKTRITHGGRCKNSWTVFKRCMCRLKDHTMKEMKWRSLHYIVRRYLGPKIMKKYLNHTATFVPPVTLVDPDYTYDEESTDPWKTFWH